MPLTISTGGNVSLTVNGIMSIVGLTGPVITQADFEAAINWTWNDDTNVASIDFKNRLLKTAITANNVLNWSQLILIDTGGITTLDWNGKQLIASGFGVVDWGSRLLNDSAGGNKSLDWDARILYAANGTDPRIDYVQCLLYSPSSGGIVTVDWSNAILKDFTPLNSMDWNGRFLYASDGVTKVLDFNAQMLAIADATGAGDIVAQFNTLLAELRTIKLLAV